MNIELEQFVYTYRTSCAIVDQEGLVKWISVLTPEYLLPSQWISVLAPVHAALKCGTEPNWYVTRHFRDRHVAASLRYRNRAVITVLICEQKLYPIWFSCRRKNYPG